MEPRLEPHERRVRSLWRRRSSSASELARGWSDEAQQHARERRVESRAQHADPDHGSRQQVGESRSHAEPLQQENGHHARRDHEETGRRNAARVVERDHENRHDVVDDGERQQQHAQRRRHAPPDERQHPDREGDIGRCRYRPAAPRGRIAVGEKVEQRGQHHTARRGDDRERGDLEIREHALVHLAADLEPDHEKENTHESIVHPEAQVLRRDEPCDPQARPDLPERLVGLRPGGIRPDEGEGRCGEQHDSAHRLDADEPQRPERRMRRLA